MAKIFKNNLKGKETHTQKNKTKNFVDPKQAIISRQEDKQSIKFKTGAIKCCKEQKIYLRLMSGITFHFG